MLAVLLAASVLLAGSARQPSPKPESGNERPALAPGAISERIACRDDPKQGYAVYLPSSYVATRPWPVVYLLDARGRARIPLDRFRGAAEELGWVLVSSFNTRSDTHDDPNTPALRAMWKDTHERLALDDRRVYLSGFSGGARASLAFALQAPTAFAGVVGCGAGFPDENAPIRSLAFPYFGTVGDRDFNYYEMRALEQKLADAKAAFRIGYFEGGHEWPPAELAREALVFLEVRGMRAGLWPRDEALAARLYREDVDRARSLEASGRLDAALVRWSDAARDFDTLADVAEARSQAARLQKSDEARRQDREARKRDDRDRAALRRLSEKISQAFAAPDLTAAGVLASELGVPALRQRAASSDAAERMSAERILATLRVQTRFYLPQRFLERQDLPRARLALGVASAIDPEDPIVDYDLACASARSGDAALALKDLDRALGKGFRNLDLLDTDEDFARIRDDPRFRKWVEDAKKGRPG